MIKIAKKYIAVRKIKVFGKIIEAGEEIKELNNKRILNTLILHNRIKVIDDKKNIVKKAKKKRCSE